MKSIYTTIFVFTILLIMIVFIPYTYEHFNNIDVDKISCIDLLRDNSSYQNLLQTIQSSSSKSQALNDLDRSIIYQDTANGPVYTYSNVCILNTDKLNNYGLTTSCGVLGNVTLQPTTSEYAIKGCIVPVSNTTIFQNTLDSLYNKKTDNITTDINNYNTSISSLQTQNSILQNSIQSRSNFLITTSNSYFNTKAQIDTYNLLYNNIQVQNSTLRNSLTTSFGNCAENAATNASQIRELGGTTKDGVYYISCAGVPKQIYCLMDSKYDGGGWMLLMKMIPGSTFQFSSQHWTNASVLNETSTNMTASDAKFEVFNTVPVKDVMALFLTNEVGKSGGSLNISGYWTWVVKNWYNNGERITPLNGFNIARDANPPNPYDFPGFDSSIFSSQSPSARHVFGGNAHLGSGWVNSANDWGTVRWGFVFNENGVNDFRSSDVWCGIGGGRNNSYEQGSYAFSAGDYYGCCGQPGLQTKLTCYLFGR